MVDKPLTMQDLHQLEDEMHAAHKRASEYSFLAGTQPNRDIQEQLWDEYHLAARDWNAAREIVYAVLWADPEW